jgi:tRNA modification GTPase
MGIERSWKAASEAQIVLYLIDASIGVLRYDSQILSKLDPASTLIVGNKQDLMQDTQKRYPGWIYLSVKTSEGFEALYNTLRERVRGFSPEEAGVTMALNHRQMKCCEDVEEKLRQVQEALNSRLPLDVVTLSLTEALQKLDELQGRNSMEDVLTQVFSRFCVGK